MSRLVYAAHQKHERIRIEITKFLKFHISNKTLFVLYRRLKLISNIFLTAVGIPKTWKHPEIKKVFFFLFLRTGKLESPRSSFAKSIFDRAFRLIRQSSRGRRIWNIQIRQVAKTYAPARNSTTLRAAYFSKSIGRDNGNPSMRRNDDNYKRPC